MAISILDINPLNGSIGVPTDQVVSVVFDQPLDLSTLDAGNIFLVSNSKDHIATPFRPLVEAERKFLNDPLEDPAYQGIVLAYYTSYFLATDSSTYSSSFKDTAATATYYTKVELTPKRPLEPNAEYRLFISGQQYTSIPVGVSERTVFDPWPDAGNSGTHNVFTRGGYDGVTNSTYEIEILTSGVLGAGKYRWRKDAGTYSGTRFIHANHQSLGNNVSVAFDLEGTYISGDKYYFYTQTASFMSGLALSTFVTGAYGSSIDLSGLTSSHVSKTASPSPPNNYQSVGPSFYVKYTVYKNFEEIATNVTNIVFHFNKTLSTSFDSNGITFSKGPMLGVECSNTEHTSYFMNNVSISGTKATVYFENT